MGLNEEGFLSATTPLLPPSHLMVPHLNAELPGRPTVPDQSHFSSITMESSIPGGDGLRSMGLPTPCPGPTPIMACFTPDGHRVTLAPSPKFLAKNEREGHNLSPLPLSVWVCEGSHHPLCPVEAVRRYMAATTDRTP